MEHIPKVWFKQAEDLSKARSMSPQDSKYAHLVGALPFEVTTEVGDVIGHVPNDHPYGKLKSTVIKGIVMSAEKCL